MGKLPMREDFEENTWILKVFVYLLQNGHPLCATHLPQILNVVSVITTQQDLLPGTNPLSVFILQLIGNADFLFVI